MSLLPLCWTYLDGEGGELTTDATYVVAPAAFAAANFAVCSCGLSWLPSLLGDLFTQFVVLGTRNTSLCLEKPLDKFGRSPSAVTHGRMVFAMEAREGPNTSRKAERLIATTGQLFEEMMATYHPLDIASKVAGKPSNTQWSFRQLWKKCGVHFVILPFTRRTSLCIERHLYEPRLYGLPSSGCSRRVALLIFPALIQQRNTCAWNPLKILAALLRQRNTFALCWP